MDKNITGARETWRGLPAVGLPRSGQLAQRERLVPSGCASDPDPGVWLRGPHLPGLKGWFPNSAILHSWSKVSGQTGNTNLHRTGARSPSSVFSGAREQVPAAPFPWETFRAPPLMARLPIRVSSRSARRLPHPGQAVVSSSFIHLAQPRQESTSFQEHTLWSFS